MYCIYAPEAYFLNTEFELVLEFELEGKFYGPLHFSRHDAVAKTIMRGRDYGLPDYNTVRHQMGLDRITRWEDINPWLNGTEPGVGRNIRCEHITPWLIGRNHG
jgi:hypothetical protein